MDPMIVRKNRVGLRVLYPLFGCSLFVAVGFIITGENLKIRRVNRLRFVIIFEHRTRQMQILELRSMVCFRLIKNIMQTLIAKSNKLQLNHYFQTMVLETTIFLTILIMALLFERNFDFLSLLTS